MNPQIENILTDLYGDFSLPEELNNNWANWVAQPVLDHNLSPRMARAILNIFGECGTRGFDIEKIITQVYNRWLKPLYVFDEKIRVAKLKREYLLKISTAALARSKRKKKRIKNFLKNKRI